MPVLHLILSAILTTCFLILVFVLSWYIALPLLIIWALWGLVRLVRDRILIYRFRRESNGCTIHPTNERVTNTTIIDADYTEIS